jgi:hypothetical protein
LEQKEVNGIKFTSDYEAGEPIFLRIFGELSNDGNGLINWWNALLFDDCGATAKFQLYISDILPYVIFI